MWKAIFQNKLTIYKANLPSFVQKIIKSRYYVNVSRRLKHSCVGWCQKMKVSSAAKKDIPPAVENLSLRTFFVYSTLQVPKQCIFIKYLITWTDLWKWEPFQNCLLSFLIHPVFEVSEEGLI
jgi:hypothetical protein